MADQRFELFTSLRYDPRLMPVPSFHGCGDNGGWNFSKPSPLYMLDFHRDRMLRAATHWGWARAVNAIAGEEGLERLEAFIMGLPELGDRPLRVKVTLSKEGQFGYEANPVSEVLLANLFPTLLPPPSESSGAAGPGSDGAPAKEPVYTVVADLEQTAQSEYTHYKTTKRDMYDAARLRAGIAMPEKEVLLVNAANGNIMEGSLTTPYLWRGGRWVTPPVTPKFSPDKGSGGQDGTTRRWSLARGLCVEEAINASTLIEGEECWISNGVRGFMFGRISLAT
ncbi:hypothetical protein GGTG_00695 [Gaeumannomyces tritici R3-111a-1]|uniref:Aminodeoxychorismate lyase n=1 Tax=Gaeumannomyces tritici (strain R3-111a-1) TaxID=644352 RepID=J3NHF8_GAET3|nr:hypothetical protein GGTG_00695 [Gaeumannomyces tritici R3-111a-1]EJT80701.1 hypothetical protein GGTG_00695 [Gaeumannomyces tritici R3-111a-1]